MASIQLVIGIIIGVILFVAVGIPVTISTLQGVTTPTFITNETFNAPSNATSTSFSYTTAHTPINAFNTASPYVTITNTSGKGGSLIVLNSNFTLAGFNSAANSYNGTIVFTALNTNVSALGVGTALQVSYAYQQSGFDSSVTDGAIYNVIPVGIAVATLVFVFTMISAGV